MSRRGGVLPDDPSSIPARLQRLGFARYAEYLASEHWQDVRRRYAVSGLPQGCACGRPRQALHHRTYVRLGCELLSDLEPVCYRCHKKRHAQQRAARQAELRVARSAKPKKRARRSRRRKGRGGPAPLSEERRAALMVRPEVGEWRFDRVIGGRFEAPPASAAPPQDQA